MGADKVSIETLRGLEPLSSLSEGRLRELAGLCHLERIARDIDPFHARAVAGQSVYLVRGELALTYPDGGSVVLVGAAEEARYPLGKRGPRFIAAKAVTDVELVRVEDDLLDIMVTWDQLATIETKKEPKAGAEDQSALTNWSILSGMFSLNNLRYGAFSQLPPAHIDGLLKQFKRIQTESGEVIIREGAQGDYYYVIEQGRCIVERMVGGVSMLLAELKSGDVFGEEALVSDVNRNATVSMKTNGTLLRLAKNDFIALLKQPLLHRVSMDEAKQKIANGGQWIDVRYPSEYQFDRLTGAINIPLAEIRNAFGLLDKSIEFVVYCQSERRSSAAAFLLAQRGFKAYLLSGGLWDGPERRAP